MSQVLCAQNMLAPPVPVRPDITSASISLFSKPLLSRSDSRISPIRTQTSRSLFFITLVSA